MLASLSDPRRLPGRRAGGGVGAHPTTTVAPDDFLPTRTRRGQDRAAVLVWSDERGHRPGMNSGSIAPSARRPDVGRFERNR